MNEKDILELEKEFSKLLRGGGVSVTVGRMIKEDKIYKICVELKDEDE